jgi:hypothetical protein
MACNSNNDITQKLKNQEDSIRIAKDKEINIQELFTPESDSDTTTALVSNINSEPNQPMQEDIFWKLIEESRTESNGIYDLQVLIMAEKLRQRNVSDITAFQNRFLSYMNDAYTWEIKAASLISNNEAADSTFENFRGWIISLGEKQFFSILKNPEKIAEANYDKRANNREGFGGCGKMAFRDKTEMEFVNTYITPKVELSGKPWKEKNLAQLYPKLWTKYRR